MRLAVASLLIPFTLYSRYPGALRVSQFDLNSFLNPFETNSFFSLKSFGNGQGRHRSSARNQSAAIALRTTGDSVFRHRQDCSEPPWEYMSAITSW